MALAHSTWSPELEQVPRKGLKPELCYSRFYDSHQCIKEQQLSAKVSTGWPVRLKCEYYWDIFST